ncbi:MAG: hypothetical protein HWD58_11250 [Bacteroidota bacterium]|nr:MAG: hypothetical protein HWD58_11250 [Bacteroidota bacterium]
MKSHPLLNIDSLKSNYQHRIKTICFSRILFPALVWSQAPPAIPYQAIARQANGDIIANQSLTIRFTVHDSSVFGPVIFRKRIKQQPMFGVYLHVL